MKTESLLLMSLIFGVLSAWSLILGVDFIIDEEKKERGRFFNCIIKIGLCKEKSRAVIFLIIWMSVAIAGLIWAVITVSDIYTNVSITSIWIATTIIMSIILYIYRRIRKS